MRMKMVQRKCDCRESQGMAGKFTVCRKQQSTLQHSAAHQTGPTAVLPIVHDVLRSHGQPLDQTTRAFMKSRLGHDFSHVRVHTDSRAAESARTVNALAYTVGRDVVFGVGQYAPGTDAGRQLLAHELTHVIQQSGVATTHGLRVGEIADNFEHTAEPTSRQVTTKTLAHDTPLNVKHTAPTLQRSPIPDSSPPADLELSPAGASMIGSLTIDGFFLGKADLTDEHKKRLAEQAETINRLLKQYPNSFISIAGHTDAVDTKERNRELGQKRADAVLAELVANKVPADIMRASSLGESALLIKTEKPEPRNRRVEIFFNARSFFKPSLTLTPPTTLGVPSLGKVPYLTKPPPTFMPPPSLIPPSITPPGTTPAKTTEPKGEEKPRPGTPGDVVKAIVKLDPVDKALAKFVDDQKKKWEKMTPGEKAATATTVVTIGAGALAGILSDPAARKIMLDQLNGQEIPFPGVSGLKVQIFTQPGGGALLKFDLTRIVPGLK